MSPRGAIPRRCPLCTEKAALFYVPDLVKKPYYWRCPSCGFIFLDPLFLPSKNAAKERYLLHDNTESSRGYGEYLERFVQTCILPFTPYGSPVLDFGAWWYRIDNTHVSFYPPEALVQFARGFGLRLALQLAPDSLVFNYPPI
jgi:hypothetical protein